MKTIDVDRELLETLFDRTKGRVRYKLGAKAPSLDADSSKIERIDCSGFARWILHRATDGRFTMPDGSQRQWAYVRYEGFKPTDFENCMLPDNRLRICFMAERGKKKGHVWLCLNGRTMESYGNVGVGSRKWNALANRVAATYVLTEPMT